MTVLVDTGVRLRLAEPAHPQYGLVDRAIGLLLGRGDEPVIVALVAAEFWGVSTRPATARGGYGLTLAETDRRLRAIEANFRLLDDLPAAYPIWRRLVAAHGVQGRQVHDARLVALMAAHQVGHVLTMNPGDFARFPGITEVDPANP